MIKSKGAVTVAKRRTASIAISLVCLATSQAAHAQNSIQAEDHFREVFLTAGYSAAFGAAMGAALLPFFPEPPMQNLRYVAGGTSLGFIFGSAFAFYNLSRNQPLYSLPQEPQDPYDSYEQSPGLGLAPEPSLPQGALVVGQGTRLGMSFPAFQVGKGRFEVALARLNF